jgi:hypothetical protein
MAHWVIHSLRQVLAPGCLPLFTSDGLNLYFYALTAHFGTWREESRRGCTMRWWQVEAGLIYGQVKKCYRGRKLVRVTQVMRLGTEDALTASLQSLGFSGRLNTAFIERAPLTVRHGIAAAFSSHPGDEPAISTPVGPFGVVARLLSRMSRPHQSLRVALVQPRARGGKCLAQRCRQRTPAMATGRTQRRWTAREVLSYPLSPVSA